MVIQDTVALGFYAGLVASIPQIIINIVLKQLNLVVHWLPQFSSSIFLFEKFTATPLGLAFGFAVWVATGGFLGVLIASFLKFTGKDHWMINGKKLDN